jgi:hypothetical protein
MVYHKKKVYRTTFRNLPFGHNYWVDSSLSVAPSEKYNRTNALGGWNTTTGAPILSSVADVSVAVVRVPRQFTKRKNI